MNGVHPTPQPSAGYPAPPPDYAAQQAWLMQQQIQAEVDRLNREYTKRLDDEVAKIGESLKKNAAAQIRAVVFAAVGVIVAGFALMVYGQTRSLNQTFIGFQNAVMGLQKEVVTTATSLGEKSSVMAAASKELELSVRQSESTRKDLQMLVDAAAKVNSELESAKRRLQETSAEYDARLKALRQRG